jgi:vancomycin resistance protein YoaR
MTDELLTAPPADTILMPDLVPESVDRRRPSARVRFGVAFLIGLLAALALGAGALYAFDRQYTGRILPGVRTGGVDLSGLTPAEAGVRLETAFASFGQGTAILTGAGLEMTIAYADIDRRPDTDAMVAEAMNVGRSGNTVDRVLSDARTALRGVDLKPIVAFDRARLARYVQTHASRLNVNPKDASVARGKSGFAIVESVEGREADRVPATEFLTAQLARIDAPSELRFEIASAPVEPEITTAEATEARLTADRMAVDIAIVQGKESWKIAGANVRSWIAFEPDEDGGLAPVVDPAGVKASLATVAKEVATTARNASFKVSGSTIVGVIEARNGRVLDVDTTAGRIGELLTVRAAGGANAPVEPAMAVSEPSLTTAEAQAVVGKMKRISTWTTYFPIGEKNGFGANIWIPALDIDGYVVGPRETFDFWNAVGPISRARGYRDGGAIINGKTEPQGALAGGICSCSTTLFNAAIRAGYVMGARRNHYYYIDRYPLGLDATVFISASGSKQTMSWTNDTDYPVLIRGYKIKDGTRGYVKFELYSVPTGRTVTFSKPIVKNVRPASDSVQYTSSLAAGVTKRVEYPVDGKDVWVTRTVRDASGKVIHQETYYSHYSRVNGLTLIGTGA